MDSLFTADFVPKMLEKAVSTLNLSPPSRSVCEPKTSYASTSKSLFPQGPPKLAGFPFLEAFQRVIETEWNGVCSSTSILLAWKPVFSARNCVLYMASCILIWKRWWYQDGNLIVPRLDASVAVFSSSAVIPSEGKRSLWQVAGDLPQTECWGYISHHAGHGAQLYYGEWCVSLGWELDNLWAGKSKRIP